MPCQTNAQESCVTAPDGLIGWWDADSVSGDVASNIAGGNEGVMGGGVEIVPGMVGNAFGLDGVDDYLDMGDLSLAGNWTVDFWINVGTLQNLDMPNFNIGRRSGDFFYVNGLIDEVEVFNRDLSAEEIASIFNAGSAGKCKAPNPIVDIPALGDYGRTLFAVVLFGLAIVLLRRWRLGSI